MSFENLKLFGSMIAYIVVIFILRKSIFAQIIFTCTYAIYVYWVSYRIDSIMKKK